MDLPACVSGPSGLDGSPEKLAFLRSANHGTRLQPSDSRAISVDAMDDESRQRKEEFRHFLERRDAKVARWRWLLPLLLGTLMLVSTLAGWVEALLREMGALFSVRTDQLVGLAGLLLAIYALVQLLPSGVGPPPPPRPPQDY